VYRLSCNPAGSRLICDPPRIESRLKPFDTAFNLEVTDPDHAGGGIKAWQSVEACDMAAAGAPSCRPPLVWRLGLPRWQTAANGTLSIVLHLELINVDTGTGVTLLGGPSNVVPLASATCGMLQRNICAIDLAIPESNLSNITDLMVLQFGNAADPTAGLRYLRSNVQPVVTGINDAQTIMTGQNLFFNQLRVGDSGSVLPLAHAGDGSECRVSAYPAKAEGYLYFLAHNGIPLQAIQLKAGVATQIHHDVPVKKPAAGAAAKTTPPTNTPPNPPTKPGNTLGLFNDMGNTKDIGKPLELAQ
jgi:hypothetical protein